MKKAMFIYFSLIKSYKIYIIIHKFQIFINILIIRGLDLFLKSIFNLIQLLYYNKKIVNDCVFYVYSIT